MLKCFQNVYNNEHMENESKNPSIDVRLYDKKWR